MLFSVIYSADVPSKESITRFKPPRTRKLWQLTEDDSQYDYGYLEGRWEHGKHRKWCALLTASQFREFIDSMGLEAEDVETMGSIGAPGCGYGSVPAISFNGDDEDAILNAYVTPIPDKLADLRERKGIEGGFTEDDWQRIRGAVMRAYGDLRAQQRYAIAS